MELFKSFLKLFERRDIMHDNSKTTALIVEDVTDDINFITDHLISVGLNLENIKSVNDPCEALAIIQTEEPTLIFVNIHLYNVDRGRINGALMLKLIHHFYKNYDYYTPFIVAMAYHLPPNLKKALTKYSTTHVEKKVRNYPALVYSTFLMTIDDSNDVAQHLINETNRMIKLTNLIRSELAPFHFNSLSPTHQFYIIDLICFIVPALGKREPNFSAGYKQIADKYNIKNPNSIKTVINRAFTTTFINVENFSSLYTGNDGTTSPKPKEFYIHIASLIKDQL